ncbi:MAG: DUF948 domain-containing protein [Nitrospirae bacterium]|nr:DUF948 domain-containing protein [Nitrospirota bacterium]
MFIEIAVGIMALSAVVLLAVLVPMLMQLRKTAEESERLLRRMNEDMPVLFREATQAAQNMNQVAGEMREAATRARVLGEAMGGVGETINEVRELVRGGAGTLLTNIGSLLAGFRAAYGVFKQKAESHHQGGPSNGG